MLVKIEDYASRWWEYASIFAYDNKENLYAVAGTVVFVVVVLYLLSKFKAFPGEEIKMKRGDYVYSKRQQKIRERSLIADGLAELLLKMSVAGELTQERYKYWHLRFGTQLAMPDLLPVKLDPVQVKQAAKARLANGVYKPVNLPKEVKARKPKNALDAILNKTT